MGHGTFKSIGLVGHLLDNSVAAEEANCILYDSTMLYSVFRHMNVSPVTNTVHFARYEWMGAAGVAKGGDSGANTEVVRDSAARSGQVVQSVYLVSAEYLL